LSIFGAGCYWGTEKYFCTDFASKYPDGAILGTSVGFMSPDPNTEKNPSYYRVCSGKTGHVEVLHILYDP
jgi:peptide-methionine (S)-S-oxide reductase